MTNDDNNRFGRDGILLQIGELRRRLLEAGKQRIRLTQLKNALEDKLQSINDRIKELKNGPDGPPTGDPEWRQLFIDQGNFTAAIARKKKEEEAVIHLMEQIKFEIEALEKGDQVARTETQNDKTAKLAMRKSGDENPASAKQVREASTKPTDPLDRSIFGPVADGLALKAFAQKSPAAETLNKLNALTSFKSVFEQAQPEKKSLAETLYPDDVPKPEGLMFKRVRKDGQRLSHAEALYPDGFPDDDYDLVKIEPLEPDDAWDDNPFKQADLRRKKKKKKLF